MEAPGLALFFCMFLMAFLFIGFVLAVLIERVRGHQRYSAGRLARGEWRLETCPHCQGRGRCPQCGGMGTLGLMGKPCPACGGGEHEEAGRSVTLRGSGRCPVCAARGQVYRVTATGQIISLDESEQ